MRSGRTDPPRRGEFVTWKPDVCEEPGCNERHPAFSRDGMKGPWRCREHDRLAQRQPERLL
jgi:hypothetical protein